MKTNQPPAADLMHLPALSSSSVAVHFGFRQLPHVLVHLIFHIGLIM